MVAQVANTSARNASPAPRKPLEATKTADAAKQKRKENTVSNSVGAQKRLASKETQGAAGAVACGSPKKRITSFSQRLSDFTTRTKASIIAFSALVVTLVSVSFFVGLPEVVCHVPELNLSLPEMAFTEAFANGFQNLNLKLNTVVVQLKLAPTWAVMCMAAVPVAVPLFVVSCKKASAWFRKGGSDSKVQKTA
eukprot:TRINITY_DN8538_c0_g1_i1.p1 TRINITY_DN8538_c0_g1~~TRINITY_DN8538_c0_g1_i1.p1  ORF type:complete len:194 (+),score=50.85 TRINITY_DN8538_c0_g1_i1:94-675(+)